MLEWRLRILTDIGGVDFEREVGNMTDSGDVDVGR